MVWLTFCDLGTFPWLLLWWLLPFLLGVLLGWILWGKYENLLEDCRATLKRCQDDYSTLQAKLDICQKSREELISDNDALRLQISSLESEIRRMNTQGQEASSTQLGFTATGSTVTNTPYTAIPQDNLQIIEGIGPAMHHLLNENGIHSWKDLAAQTQSGIQAMLDKHGSKYRIIDPSTWMKQAALARDGKWQDLIKFQKDLSGSVLSTSNQTNAKVEKVMIKMGLLKKFKQDDLKAIEGIGPKIEELLHNAGITTWKALAETSVNTLEKILTAAGTRFTLADPATWPQQAGLAEKGDWKGLQQLQDYLQGGKEPR